MTSVVGAAKRGLLALARRHGYQIVKTEAGDGDLGARYAHAEMLRQIHRRDVSDLEELYRRFVLPDLPSRAGREALLSELIGTSVSEALYLLDALHKALAVEGDICEFGVAQGATSQLIAAEIMATDRLFWLFDSFEGLPPPSGKDVLIDDIFNLGSLEKYTGTMSYGPEVVQGRLRRVEFPAARTRIKKGWIADTLAAGDLPARVAFAYLDFDYYQPIKDALAWLDTVLPVGAQIVIDDYGFFSAGAQAAVDEFRAAVGARYAFALPLDFAGHFAMMTKVAP
jgi:hypothetical protein